MRLFVLIFISFLPLSIVFANDLPIQSNNHDIIVNTSDVGISDLSGADDTELSESRILIKQRRKFKRLEMGEKIVTVGLESLSSSNTGYAGLLVVAPVVTVGLGFMIWGALTKVPVLTTR